ncbi:hypothetical protein D3C76_1109480 [compost metagenome]
MKLKKIFIYEILGFFFISIFGIIFNYIYELYNNDIIALFGAVNESIWEQVKVYIIPSLIWLIIEYFNIKEIPNFAIAKLSSIVLINLINIFIQYVFRYILSNEVLMVNTLVLYTSILLAQMLSYKIIVGKVYSKGLNSIATMLIIVILSLYVAFTYLV